MTDFEVDKLIVVTSAKKGAKGQQLDQQLINDGLALYQEQLNDVSLHGIASLHVMQMQMHVLSGLESARRHCMHLLSGRDRAARKLAGNAFVGCGGPNTVLAAASCLLCFAARTASALETDRAVLLGCRCVVVFAVPCFQGPPR